LVQFTLAFFVGLFKVTSIYICV